MPPNVIAFGDTVLFLFTGNATRAPAWMLKSCVKVWVMQAGWQGKGGCPGCYSCGWVVQPCFAKPVSMTDSAVTCKSSLRVDVKIFPSVAAASLISHPQLGKTVSPCWDRRHHFAALSLAPTKWWFWKAHILEDISLTPDSWFFCNCPLLPLVKYMWTD